MKYWKYFLMLLLILIIFSIIYFFINLNEDSRIKRQLPSILSNISDYDYSTFARSWNTAGCEMRLNDINKSLVNIIHIKKFDTGAFQINCERGPAYYNLVDDHIGKFPNCDEQVAEKIDEALKTKSAYFKESGELTVIDLEKACFVPMLDVIPEDADDYYLFVFDCRQWTNDDLSSWSAACFDESTIIEERHRIGFFVVDTDSYKLYS